MANRPASSNKYSSAYPYSPYIVLDSERKQVQFNPFRDLARHCQLSSLSPCVSGAESDAHTQENQDSNGKNLGALVPSVIQGLIGLPPASSQATFIDFQNTATRLRGSGPEVTVRWVPGHEDIPGNEAANRLAKLGTKASVDQDDPVAPLAILAYIKKVTKLRPKLSFNI
ncbi:hypothetical protein QBC46DRAFT_347906 [Diplogelasinospora grovesii]|uniref:RNase H type-1 domain-containing protein n=1 Tax=Diplogelasinospora grovesii TaxID=303347 RepID=A0AAN6MYF6_9PEZI|nr:hypothetical protein QBC46DRAFT_347906 [Diplogelasinospora grovesii]